MILDDLADKDLNRERVYENSEFNDNVVYNSKLDMFLPVPINTLLVLR